MHVASSHSHDTRTERQHAKVQLKLFRYFYERYDMAQTYLRNINLFFYKVLFYLTNESKILKF